MEIQLENSFNVMATKEKADGHKIKDAIENLAQTVPPLRSSSSPDNGL